MALSPDAKDMAENLYRALWSLLICIFVTIAVSLFTTPKSEGGTDGTWCWKYTVFPRVGDVPLWKKPIFWACGVAIFFAVLQWMFW